MLINKIVLDNFMSFKGKHNFYFERINFIKGKNGVGKTTIINNAVNFVLFGYPGKDKKLEDLPTRDITNNCSVSIRLILNQDTYDITREYPSKITIYKNGQDLKELKTPAEKNKFIEDTFHNREYFRKFRMIDKDNGTDILDEGNVSIKKTLFSYHEELLNKVREQLAEEKRYREQYVLIQSNLNLCYPSLKRLEVLNKYYQSLSKELSIYQTELWENQGCQKNLNREIGQIEQNIKIHKQNQDKLNQETKCYACGQSVSKENKEEQLVEIGFQLVRLNDNRAAIQETINGWVEETAYLTTKIEEVTKRINKIVYYKNRLESILKQQDKKFTEKDIINVKEAIKEVDRFSNSYLLESVQSLEPIINSVLEKINYKLEFTPNNKGDFDITLYKDNKEFKRSDMSTGQKLMLNVAFKLALLLQRQESGIIIIDEGMANLDDENVLNIFELFNNWEQYQLVTVLHRFENIPEYVNIINLENYEK